MSRPPRAQALALALALAQALALALALSLALALALAIFYTRIALLGPLLAPTVIEHISFFNLLQG